MGDGHGLRSLERSLERPQPWLVASARTEVLTVEDDRLGASIVSSSLIGVLGFLSFFHLKRLVRW